MSESGSGSCAVRQVNPDHIVPHENHMTLEREDHRTDELNFERLNIWTCSSLTIFCSLVRKLVHLSHWVYMNPPGLYVREEVSLEMLLGRLSGQDGGRLWYVEGLLMAAARRP
ncbi:unnamed protein product [Pleuronectes platessa]|uniref:Uncharacterized protein n=1 Tax=Pleuronectes platessa TaxID=8262 RepID=A0A9N7W4E9_PLEPL|nr:unnamed protein product [Pleuronectes platessa]